HRGAGRAADGREDLPRPSRRPILEGQVAVQHPRPPGLPGAEGRRRAAAAGRRRRGGFSFGLEADKATLGVGAFDFGPADLEKYRRAVAADSDGEELTAILAKMAARPGDADLKRVPAPYPQDHPRAELLKHKGLNVWQDLAGAPVGEPELADVV